MILILVILFALAGGIGYGTYRYLQEADYYKEHFYAGTVINGTDCSDMTAEEARQTIQARLNEYTFTFTDHEGISSVITAPEIGLTYADNGEVQALLDAQDTLLWIFDRNRADAHQVTPGYTYNKDLLLQWADTLPCITDGVAPTDAYEHQLGDGYFEIVPETEGDLPDTAMVEERIVSAVDQALSSADLSDADYFIHPAVRADDEELVASVTEKNEQVALAYEMAERAARAAEEAERAARRAEMIEEITNVELIFNSFVDRAYLNQDILKQMIMDDENGDPAIDPSLVREWIRQWAEERGILSNNCLFVTHGGRLMCVDQGVLAGWSFDLDATAEKACQTIAERTSGIFYPVLRDEGGNLQSDATYVEINIMKQTMWYYENGEQLVETPVVTGNVSTGYDTPSNGVWYIYQKLTNYTMHGPQLYDGSYEYVAYVDYWMPFNGQIGIHDMQTRYEFGGEIYLGNGSHGCINTPYEAAELIFMHAYIGTPVVVHS